MASLVHSPQRMLWAQVLDEAFEALRAFPEIPEETARLLVFCADSHEPWCRENCREDFSAEDVHRLVRWLLDNRWIIS